jgi:antitoxin (DNA-binding transcriptional repressor) of toxin-antitoxin stability system
MSVATLQQFGQSLPSWVALVQRGETVAIMDGEREVARLVPPEKRTTATTLPAKQPAADASWMKNRLAELEKTFPEPVIGASEELEAFRAERF